MVKGIIVKLWLIFSLFILSEGLEGAQASQVSPFLWSKRMKGAISDLSIAENGKGILVATSPDSDIPGSAKHYLLTLLEESGRVVWQKKVKYPVKEQDISHDGSLIVFANYENQIIAFNHQGQKLWSRSGMCRPQILNPSKKILCYHDDDAEPKIAFDIFTWDGKKELSFPITSDILALKVGQDERHIAFGLTEGQVSFLDPEFHLLWQKKVDGEVVDVAVGSGEKPNVAVLYQLEKGKGQKITFFDFKGKSKGTFSPGFRTSQLEISSEGDRVFYYGNSSEGQYLGSASMSTLKEEWRKGGKYASDYSSSILVSPFGVTMGFQEIDETSRTSHVLSFDSAGNSQRDLKLRSDPEAYIYSHRIAVGSSALVVGTDDARLSLTRIGQP